MLYMNRKTHSVDMTVGSPLKHILRFAIPLIFTGLLQSFYSSADMVVVGRFAGEDALAAVGSTSSAINLIINLFIGMSTAAGVLVARKFGAKNQGGVTKAVHTAIALSIVGGLVLTVVGFFVAGPLMEIMGAPTETFSLSVLYMRIYFAGAVPMLLYNFGGAILRGIGDTKRPLIYLIISGIINVVLNVILVAGFNMSVDGVAIATLISQMVSAILVLRALMNTDECYKLIIKKLHIYKAEYLEILRLGIPAGIQSSVFSFSNLIIQSSINSVGAIAMAGNAAAASIEGFVYFSMNAFYQASVTFTSQNYGAYDFKRIRKGVLRSALSVGVLGAVLGILLAVFAENVVGLFSEVPEVIRCGAVRVRIICSLYLLVGFMEVATGAVRGLGLSIRPMIITIVCLCGGRIAPILFYGPYKEVDDLMVLYLSYPLSWFITTIANYTLFIVTYKSRKKKYLLQREEVIA